MKIQKSAAIQRNKFAMCYVFRWVTATYVNKKQIQTDMDYG